MNISESIWKDKYRYTKEDGTSDEATILDTHKRVVNGVYKLDPERDLYVPEAINAMKDWLWCPGGRIHAGAGTPKRVTLINCYVNQTVPDSMVGIIESLNIAALTQQQGGGIGTDFSTIRPKGAIVHSTGSISSGILPFMDMWNSMCATIKSSGSRRGAMMGTLACWHPDLLDFIVAKQTKGRLTNFNVSVLITSDFMRAVENDAMWNLGFNTDPKEAPVEIVPRDNLDNPTNTDWWRALTGQAPSTWFVYKRLPARVLWEQILRNTYDHAEPGVIFIDRINEQNNLSYCEHLATVNPCGEQPLPPNGDCNLGCVNLAKLVKSPFGTLGLEPQIQFDLLSSITTLGMRFLDNVLDVSLFPTPEQKEEAFNKRRTGIGITALANLLQQMKIRYGSPQAVEITRTIMETQRDAAYWASVDLAKERGPFPLFDKNKYLSRPYIKRLPVDLQDAIAQYGIRNGVIQTIAPTGTTSIYYQNVSSGLEPTFAWKHFRKVLQPDNSFAEFEVEDYGYKVYRETGGDTKTLPPYMVTALELSVDEHLNMQAACQEFIDASISKTINCPKEISFEEFKAVYSKAYELGLKGVTTYRPSETRGAVLTTESQKVSSAPVIQTRAKSLNGVTYKIKWPIVDQAFYLTINDVEENGKRRPFEIFINSKSVKHEEWIKALTRCISAIFRRGGDVTFIIEELTQVYSAAGGTHIDGEYVPSLVALIGKTIQEHMMSIGLIPSTKSVQQTFSGEVCPKCNQMTLIRQEGCEKCSCGYSSC